ncbi:uncharacterized protein LTR77_005010 [Saxophila tyrrhenica]|uniref:Cell division control protein 14 n=1 Tax=Saxophila tyrrhenica TaxID=1690608 RepID=A0AAV9PE62_9PEZI|nr:hypothetical protein LTR77_005010 [Saxophila tyrrhenica]
MESLLSVGFDNISSRDSSKIRKGLRQIEGLLAQVCLSQPSSRSPHKRKSSHLSSKQPNSPKKLGELKSDPAFREFFRIQEGFQWNVASRLVSTLERLMGMGNPSQTDLLIVSTLDLLQGVLLLHPPSRCLFNREIHMNLLLDLLDSFNPPAVQSQAVLVLVAALLDCPRNIRTFENVDGLLTVTSLFRSRDTAKDVRMKTLEFLYFYLMQETPIMHAGSAPNTAVLQRSPSKIDNGFAGHARTHSGDSGGDMMDVDEDERETRTMSEKQRMLGQYLNNVAELVQDLEESAPFGVPQA